jgi:four helix bundle protein
MSDDKEDPSKVLGHEGLDVYHVSLDFIEYVEEILANVPKDNAHLIDQLRRSSSSIVLNIAEGSGRSGPTDRARFYMISRGSASESSSTLDVLHRRGHLSFQDLVRGKTLTKRIIAMMTKLAKSMSTMKK